MTVPPRVQVVAHRGASYDMAEHTLAAYETAVEQGADALECDVRLTRDGHLVCVHDRRIDRTSTGSGVLSTLALADLEGLDFGSWRDRTELRPEDLLPRADDLDDGTEVGPDPEGEVDRDRIGVLTLHRLLELVVDAPRRVELHVECKHPVRYGARVERVLVDTLDRFGVRRVAGDAPVTVMSFAPVALRRVRALAPGVPTVLLLPRLPRWLATGQLPAYATAAGPSLGLLRRHPSFVSRVQATGRRVHVWTVDDEADVGYVLGLGVDAVISNRPAEVARLRERTGQRRDWPFAGSMRGDPATIGTSATHTPGDPPGVPAG